MAGQIINRGEKIWLVRIFLGRDTKGKRAYFNKTIHGTKNEAQKYLTAKLREKDLGVFVEPSSISLSEHLDKWIKTTAKPRLRENTFTHYKGLIERYIKPSLGAKKLSELRTVDIQSFYADLLEKGLSGRTVRYTHSILSSALKEAVAWLMISQNPCTAVRLPKKKTQDMTALTPDEAKRFLEAAKEEKWFALFLLAITTGMRPSEYFALKWSDIDFESGVIAVQRSVKWRTNKSGEWYFDEPKTPRSRRSIPLMASEIRALKDHRRKQNEERLKAGAIYKNNDLIFATGEGCPLIRENLVQRHFKPLLKKAGLPQTIRLYDLRHTCATLLLAANENPKVVQERLGHSSIVMTMDTYSHVLPNMQKDASSKLENILNIKVGTQ